MPEGMAHIVLVDNKFFTPEPTGSVYKNVVHILELDNVGE
jgi:hypothetical protein